ncbi:putative fad dependent oxidoreductase superfamily protein [Phaeoacremonium minimum UCRPA7]|uniref:Putative fad dependent oxidoreductase superfamily protein n=1 Tax=Phaeoacremonium minimum (strain UCR-PA7) TaxID=1286976 RepID=R8BG89_PHAM7|nr:putative fad dependent oxidoreductase superfamily protein [Phaeoacremonium minimum UCRPA7]EON98316.1 putative fad dependent oxidoreductase superfamily protein [Phaeoacremonium minimum UCRPA7]
MPGENVVVIGAGVIGLSSAIKLQELGYQVTIVARDLPGPFESVDPKGQINFTSPWGGAHNRWVPPAGGVNDVRDHWYSVETFHAMAALAKAHPEAGITFLKGIEYLEKPGPEYQELTEEKAKELRLIDWRRLKPEELPPKVTWGCEYKTWCVNPAVYCPFLLRRFTFRGGKTVKKEIREPKEIFSMKDLPVSGEISYVVNCSGNGFSDDKVFITRGQTCLVANTADATVTRQNADGSWTFNVPRFFEGGTIIGGTKEVDNWDTEPSLELRETLLKNFAATYPKILGEHGKMVPIKDIVGRRPTRHGGARIETELLKLGSSSKPKTIVHGYGLGGRGYELSWGVANAVAKLVTEGGSKAKL